MIVMQLAGGLGNQMFQYACGRALSLRHNVDLLLDPSILSLARTPRTYQLKEAWNIDTQLVQTPNNTAIIHEKHYHFDSEILKVKKGYFKGYWQSEKYFKDFEHIIRQDFDVSAASLPTFYDKETPVSIHVRRGDYILDRQTNAVHGTCSIEYYQKCIDYIKTKVENPIFLLFSDNIDWAEDNIGAHPVIVSKNLSDYQEMQLMSKCSHNIIANSSFSWWAAWLNVNPNKIVLAPTKWFNDPSLNTKDLLPESWITL